MLRTVIKPNFYTVNKIKDISELKDDKQMLSKCLEGKKRHVKMLQEKALRRNFDELKRKQSELSDLTRQQFGKLNNTLQGIPDEEKTRECECDQKSTSNIKQLINGFTFLNGIDLTEKDRTVTDNAEKYFFIATSGPVEFYFNFTWSPTSEKCSFINVSFCTLLHQEELASRINKCVRESKLPTLLKTIAEYSDLFIQRENALKKLYKENERYFKYTESKNYGGYSIVISDEMSGVQYLKANWCIKYFKARYAMDHTFHIKVIQGAEELGESQENLLIQLTTKEGLSGEEIVETFTQLTKAFEQWIVGV